MKLAPRLKLIQSWQTYSKGAFIRPDGAILRNWLIATGRAVLAADDAPAAPAAPAADTAVTADAAPTRTAKTRRSKGAA